MATTRRPITARQARRLNPEAELVGSLAVESWSIGHDPQTVVEEIGQVTGYVGTFVDEALTGIEQQRRPVRDVIRNGLDMPLVLRRPGRPDLDVRRETRRDRAPGELAGKVVIG